MQSHAECIPLARQMCASFDAPPTLCPAFCTSTRWISRGSTLTARSGYCSSLGAKLERPKFLEADGTSHEVTPEECHLRNLTYSMPMYTDVHLTMNEETEILPSVYMGRIPLMLGSKYDPNPNPCPFDPSGYFICKGTEKSIIFQRRTSTTAASRCTAASTATTRTPSAASRRARESPSLPSSGTARLP